MTRTQTETEGTVEKKKKYRCGGCMLHAEDPCTQEYRVGFPPVFCPFDKREVDWKPVQRRTRRKKEAE